MSYFNPATILPPKKSRFNPKKSVVAPPGPPPRDGFISEDSPYNLTHARATRSQPPAGQYFQPKISSAVVPDISQRSQLSAPHIRHDDQQIRIHQNRGFGIQQYESVRPPSPTYPSEDQLQMPPARGAATQGTSRRSVESLAREFHQLSQELHLKQSLAGLSLTPHVDEQQGYSSGQYPHVYVEPFPDPLQSLVPWQQRQLQQQDYEHVRHDQALPSFQPQQKEQHQQIQPYPSLVQQHAIPQDQNTFFEQRREVKRHYAPTSGSSQSLDQPMDAMAEIRLPTGIGVRKIEPITMSTHKERRELRHQFSRSLSDRSGSFGRASLQEFSPSHDSTAPVRLSGVTADDDDLEMLQRASLGPGTFGSTESDEVLQSRIPREQIQSSIHMPLASQTAVPVFPEAREDLKRLRADIEDLSVACSCTLWTTKVFSGESRKTLRVHLSIKHNLS